jgi:hypothetical protein
MLRRDTLLGDEIRRNFQTYGAEGLIDRLPGTRGPHSNRVSAEIEQAVLRPCADQSMSRRGARRAGASSQRASRSPLAASGGVWQRHALLTKGRAPAAAGEGHRRTQA